MTTGTVKWFNGQKGFGFIQPTTAATMCSFTSVRSKGPVLSNLAEGQKVNFEVKTDKMRVSQRRKPLAGLILLAPFPRMY